MRAPKSFILQYYLVAAMKLARKKRHFVESVTQATGNLFVRSCSTIHGKKRLMDPSGQATAGLDNCWTRESAPSANDNARSAVFYHFFLAHDSTDVQLPDCCQCRGRGATAVGAVTRNGLTGLKVLMSNETTRPRGKRTGSHPHGPIRQAAETTYTPYKPREIGTGRPLPLL